MEYTDRKICCPQLEERLSFLKKCIDEVNLSTEKDIQLYREMYNKDCAMPMKSYEFEFVFPTDDFDSNEYDRAFSFREKGRRMDFEDGRTES